MPPSGQRGSNAQDTTELRCGEECVRLLGNSAPTGRRWNGASTRVLGALSALGDLPRNPGTIPAEARAWVVSLVASSRKTWVTRRNCGRTGESCSRALRAGGSPESGPRGTVWKILAGHKLRPHRIEYYLEKRPEFDTKMAQVLVLYKLAGPQAGRCPGGPVNYDEKPIQAIGGVAPVPPEPGKHSCTGRDYEYQRHGRLMAGWI